MNTDFLIRNFEPEQDVAALARLWRAAAERDRSGFAPDEEQVRARLALPGHDPARERWVAVQAGEAGELLGYCLVWLPPEAETLEINLLVHPDWRAGGLPELLWQHLLAQASERSVRRLHLTTARHPFGLAGFWEQRGFRLEGGYSRLRRSSAAPMPAPALPTGLHLRPYSEVQNVELAAQLMHAAYAGLWGHNEVSAEQMAGWLPEFDLEGFFLLFGPADDPAGICRCEINAELTERNGRRTGYIDAPGLMPAYRSREHYRQALRAVAAWLYAQGAEWLEMESWGDSPETLDLYLAEGFEWVSSVASYSRLLAV